MRPAFPCSLKILLQIQSVLLYQIIVTVRTSKHVWTWKVALQSVLST